MKLTLRNGLYVVDYRDSNGKRKRISTGKRDKTDAWIVANDIFQGGTTLSPVWTLANALDHTLEYIWHDAKSFHQFDSLVGLVKADLGHLTLDEVTHARLKLWVKTLKERGLKAATINRRLSVIRRALVEASREGKLGSIPSIPKQVENNKKFLWLSEDDECNLLAACTVVETAGEGALLRRCIEFLIDTGARVGEMMKMRPYDISKLGVLFRDTKSSSGTYKSRTVPLTYRAEKAAQVIANLNEDDLMFTRDQLFRKFDRAKNAANLRHINRHTLRHTCASRLVQRGADIYRVKEWLGHSNVTTTERYAHLGDTGMSDMAALLEQ